MSKRKPNDDYQRSDSGLWLPKYGLRGPRKPYDSWRYMPGYPCCCRGRKVECDWCSGSGNNAPEEVMVTLAGVDDGAGDSGYCPNCCPDLNDTFILTWRGTGPNWCYWDYDISDCRCEVEPCNFQAPRLNLRLYNKVLTLRILWTTDICGGNNSRWEKVYDDTPDCLGWEEEELTYVYDVLDVCGYSSATCVISAL